MIKRIKIAFTLLVLAVFCFNFFGFYFLYQANKQFLQENMASFLELNTGKELPLVKITEDFQLVNSCELMVQGKMYDIVYKETRDGTTSYYCVNDKHEDQLLAQLNEHVNLYVSGSSAPVKSGKSSMKNFEKDYFPPLRQTDPCLHQIKISFSDFLSVSAIKIFADQPAPPPKRA